MCLIHAREQDDHQPVPTILLAIKIAILTHLWLIMSFLYLVFYITCKSQVILDINRNSTRLVYILITSFHTSAVLQCGQHLKYYDTVKYLVHTMSQYRHEQFKAYKSLEAYNYFLVDHVHSTSVWEILWNYTILKKLYHHIEDKTFILILLMLQCLMTDSTSNNCV